MNQLEQNEIICIFYFSGLLAIYELIHKYHFDHDENWIDMIIQPVLFYYFMIIMNLHRTCLISFPSEAIKYLRYSTSMYLSDKVNARLGLPISCFTIWIRSHIFLVKQNLVPQKWKVLFYCILTFDPSNFIFLKVKGVGKDQFMLLLHEN